MADNYSIPKAEKQKPKAADIVFCIDVTKSMQNCIDNIKLHVRRFIEGLQTAAQIDYRLALVAYRDIHDEKIWERGIRACDEPWVIKDFTQSVTEFLSWLELPEVQAYGGGVEPESTLDALYLAIHMKSWRDKAHRTIVLFTDSDSHPTLHAKTYKRKDNGVERVIQDIQTLKHSILYMVVPRYRVYETLEKAAHSANRKVIAKYVQDNDEGLRSIDFSRLLAAIGSTVSSSSLNLHDLMSD